MPDALSERYSDLLQGSSDCVDRIVVNHYSFHILDPQWGHATIKMSGHPPFPAQVMLNGHEYVARQAKQEGSTLQKKAIVLLR
jgi:hypothetical protein